MRLNWSLGPKAAPIQHAIKASSSRAQSIQQTLRPHPTGELLLCTHTLTNWGAVPGNQPASSQPRAQPRTESRSLCSYSEIFPPVDEVYGHYGKDSPRPDLGAQSQPYPNIMLRWKKIPLILPQEEVILNSVTVTQTLELTPKLHMQSAR